MGYSSSNDINFEDLINKKIETNDKFINFLINRYEEIKKEFGVEPVKIMAGLNGKTFQNMELDKNLQVAEMTYTYGNEKIIYLVSASYRDSSLGIDVEDTVIDQYYIEKKGCSIEVKEYEISESKMKRCSARFEYSGVQYFLMGTVNKEEFEKIIEKLYFVVE